MLPLLFLVAGAQIGDATDALQTTGGAYTSKPAKGILLSVAKANSSGQLIRQWQAANENCRGGSGDDPKTIKACDVRDTLARQLEDAKWCYGKNGQSSYQYKWHRCGKGSIHY